MTHFLFALIILGMMFMPILAEAQLVVPVSQTRSVAGNANGNDNSGSATDSDSDEATDFAPFSSGASGDITLVDVAASGSGNQTSSILSDRLDVFGGCGGFAETYIPDLVDASAGGSSVFDVTFDLTVESDYTLSGMLGAFDNGSVTLVFSGPSGTILSGDGCCDGFWPVNHSGTLPAGQYRLQITSSFSANAFSGDSDYGSGEYDIDLVFDPVPTGVRDVPGAPFALRSWPNPFSQSSEIQFSVSKDVDVELVVFSASGKRVATLANRRVGAGTHHARWNGFDGLGQRLNSGVYFLRLRAGTLVETRKVVLVD